MGKACLPRPIAAQVWPATKKHFFSGPDATWRLGPVPLAATVRPDCQRLDERQAPAHLRAFPMCPFCAFVRKFSPAGMRRGGGENTRPDTGLRYTRRRPVRHAYGDRIKQDRKGRGHAARKHPHVHGFRRFSRTHRAMRPRQRHRRNGRAICAFGLLLIKCTESPRLETRQTRPGISVSVAAGGRR